MVFQPRHEVAVLNHGPLGGVGEHAPISVSAITIQAGGVSIQQRKHSRRAWLKYKSLKGENTKRIELGQQMTAIGLALAGMFLGVGLNTESCIFSIDSASRLRMGTE